MAELRWNPVLSEWVIVADERQDRPVLPEDSCPLCPGVLEVPEEDYYIVSFENRFPALRSEPDAPSLPGDDFYRTRGRRGVCEVLLYTPDHDLAPAELDLTRLQDLIRVWKDRLNELGSKDFIDYVYIFENRGEEIGVSLYHPHGQIYAFPFVPPVIEKELENARNHWKEEGDCLFCRVLEKEKGFQDRIVYENEGFTAFVPFYARFPYEVHLYPRRHIPDLSQLDGDEEAQFARALKTVLSKYSRLFPEDEGEFPYMMVFHGAPVDGGDYDYFHFHLEFYSLKRGAGKIKYRAGVETGAGTFISSISPEDMASRLREAPSELD